MLFRSCLTDKVDYTIHRLYGTRFIIYRHYGHHDGVFADSVGDFLRVYTAIRLRSDTCSTYPETFQTRRLSVYGCMLDTAYDQAWVTFPARSEPSGMVSDSVPPDVNMSEPCPVPRVSDILFLEFSSDARAALPGPYPADGLACSSRALRADERRISLSGMALAAQSR